MLLYDTRLADLKYILNKVMKCLFLLGFDFFFIFLLDNDLPNLYSFIRLMICAFVPFHFTMMIVGNVVIRRLLICCMSFETIPNNTPCIFQL